MTPRVIVISGGSKGLGRAFVEHFLSQGDIVCTFSRSSTKFVEETLANEKYRERFFFREADQSSRTDVKAFVQETHRRFQRIDALVNNAGVTRDGLLSMMSHDDIDLVLDVNLKGALYLMRACLRPMLVARRGRIINVSSIIGLRGYRGLAAYASTKAGLDAATRAMAREVGSRGITVNSIAPGYLATEMTHGLDESQMKQIACRTPLGRLGTPADVLPALDFLLSAGADFITGHVLVVDGGLTA